jgi:hypothetical protein
LRGSEQRIWRSLRTIALPTQELNTASTTIPSDYIDTFSLSSPSLLECSRVIMDPALLSATSATCFAAQPPRRDRIFPGLQ